MTTNILDATTCFDSPLNSGGSRGAIEVITPLKPTKVTLSTMILYNSENSIRDIKPFCSPLICHSSVVKYTSSLVQQSTRNES